MPNFGYHCALLEGSWRRKSYSLLLPAIVRRRVRPPRAVALSVFAYSGEKTVPEQVKSIRSFLRHVGRPKSYTVISDGSHSDHSVRLLEQIDFVVSVRPSGDQLPADLPPKFLHYITTHPIGKQLGLVMSLPRNGPALYVDSDVLFFPGAADLLRYVPGQEVSALYLADCQTSSADPRIFRGANEELHPVNCGCLMLFRKLDWSLGIQRYLDLEGEPNFFTNQTIVHLTMHANGAKAFDERKYVLRLDDQCIYPDRYASRHLALRHYVSPVRHKFWTTH